MSDLTAYRYRLTREWDAALPPLGWIMLNPSTADDTRDDPTIRKCVGFARRNGYGSIRVANIIPARATKPADLNALRTSGSPGTPSRTRRCVGCGSAPKSYWLGAGGVTSILVRGGSPWRLAWGIWSRVERATLA